MRKLLIICCILTVALVGCEDSGSAGMTAANIAAYSDDELREMGFSNEDILALRETVSGNELIDPDNDLYFTDISKLTKENYMYYVGDLPEDGAQKGTVYYELVQQGLMPGYYLMDEEDDEIEEDPDLVTLNAYGNPVGDNYHPPIEFKDSKYGKHIPEFMEEAINDLVEQYGFTNVIQMDVKEDVNEYDEALVVYTYHMSPCRNYDPSLRLNAPTYDEYYIVLNLNQGGLTITSLPNAYETREEKHTHDPGSIAIEPEYKVTPTPTPVVTTTPTRVPVATPIPTPTAEQSESSSTPTESSSTTEVSSEEQVVGSDEQVVSSDEVVSSSD